MPGLIYLIRMGDRMTGHHGEKDEPPVFFNHPQGEVLGPIVFPRQSPADGRHRIRLI